VGRPGRDLYLSPDHAVFTDGVLIPVRYLVNGATIVRQEFSHVTYWHVELPVHGVVLAEGLAAESYLDTGNRAAFAEGSKARALPWTRQRPGAFGNPIIRVQRLGSWLGSGQSPAYRV
jgi:hypothetical protein